MRQAAIQGFKDAISGLPAFATTLIVLGICREFFSFESAAIIGIAMIAGDLSGQRPRP